MGNISNKEQGACKQGTGRRLVTKLALLVTILTLTILASTVTVSATNIPIAPGEPRKTYGNVYDRPFSNVSFPNLTFTQWFDKAYYLFVHAYAGYGQENANKIDLPIQDIFGAKAEYTGTQEGAYTGERIQVYRFVNGISRENMQYLLRNYLSVRTERQANNQFGFNIYVSTDPLDGANTTGQTIPNLTWNGNGLHWAYDVTYTKTKYVWIQCRSSIQCSYLMPNKIAYADYKYYSLEGDSTKPGSLLVSATMYPKYPSDNCFYLVYVDGEQVAEGQGNKSDGIPTVVFYPPAWKVYKDVIYGKIGGGNCAHAVNENNGVDVEYIISTWRYKGRKDVNVYPGGTSIYVNTIPKQYPINVSYNDRYNWQNVPNPKDETVLFRSSWIESPYTWTYSINSSNLTKTGYTWDERWYGSSDTFRRSESLGYRPLYEYWQRAGSQYGWVNGRYCRLLPLNTKNNTPHEYDIVYKDNSSWNAPADTTQHMVYDQTYNLNQNQYTRNTGEKRDGSLILDGYTFSGWTTFQDQSGTSSTFGQSQTYTLDGTNRGLYSSDLLGNSCSVKNLTATNNEKIYLYPNFKKGITVNLSLNNPGSTFKGDGTQQKTKTYTIYNRESATINLSDLTDGLPIYGYPKMFGDWKRSNGLNDLWQKSVISTNEGGLRGTAYRMIGLSTVPTRTSTQNEILYPTSKSYVTPYNFSTYNKRNATQIEIVNDIELYELWEPELALQSSATGAGIKTVETPRFTRHTGTQYLDLKLPAGTKITTEHLIDGVEPFQTGPELTITRLYPQKFSDMYTKAFQSKYPTLTDKLNTLQTFTDNETKVSNIKNTYRENEIFSIPTYLDTAEYNRLTGQAYDKNAVYAINYTVEQPSDFTKWVYGEPNERLSTCIRVQLPTADTEPGDESGGGGGADNTPNKVRLHLNLHTKDETN